MMRLISNYEVAMAAIQGDNGSSPPIIALSFSSHELPSPVGEWTQDNCQLEITQPGLAATLDGQAVLFPLSSPEQAADPRNPMANGVDREKMMDLIRSYGHLFVCAFDDQGDLVANIGFNLTQG